MAPARFTYVPAEELAGRPHVMVDGMPRPGTVCTLSHWPGTPTAHELWDDVSAGIVLRALSRPGFLPDGVDVASIDHYDEDGAIALGLLCVEGLATAHGPMLVEAARVGDFGVVEDRGPALVAFALAALGRGADDAPESESEGASGGSQGPDDDVMGRCARSATAALSTMAALADDPVRFEELWGDEARAFDAAVRVIDDGVVVLEEHPRHDLAVVRVDVAHSAVAPAAWDGAPIHRAAVHSSTTRLRILTIAGARFELRYRYESWVRMTSRRPRPRVDLGPLAAELTKAEQNGARWVFDGASALTGALHLAGDGPSTLDPDRLVETVCERLEALDAGPAAWDPYTVPVPPG